MWIVTIIYVIKFSELEFVFCKHISYMQGADPWFGWDNPCIMQYFAGNTCTVHL